MAYRLFNRNQSAADSIEEKIEELSAAVPIIDKNEEKELINDAIKANSIDIYVKKIETLLERFPDLRNIEQGNLSNEEYYNKLFRAASNNQISYIVKHGFNSINLGLEYYLTYFAHINIKGYADLCKNDPNIDNTLELIRIKNMAVLENVSPEYLLLIYMGTNMISVYNMNKALERQ